MNKTELLAALQDPKFDRDALLATLEVEAEAERAKAEANAAYRERPSVRVHLDAFNQARQDLYQPAIYRKSSEDLAVALKSMLVALEDVAVAAGVNLDEVALEAPTADEE
jgi:hypothetical protein